MAVFGVTGFRMVGIARQGVAVHAAGPLAIGEAWLEWVGERRPKTLTLSEVEARDP